MQSKSEIIGVLLGCQRVAQAMAEFYERLALLHAVMAPEAARVWRISADSHRNHGFQIKFAIDNVDDMIAKVRVGMEAVHKANAAVNHIVLECKRRPPTVEQAARAAVEFEKALQGIHLDKVATCTTPRHMALFRAMLAANRDHLPLIKQLLGIAPDGKASAGASNASAVQPPPKRRHTNHR